MPACKECGGSFYWKQIEGRWRPFDADGELHWIRCKAEKISGPLHIKGPTITGADYRPSCGLCAVPPWEECACSFTREDASRTRHDASVTPNQNKDVAIESQMSPRELEQA